MTNRKGLHGPHSRIVWMKNELTTTASISPAQTQPNRRCGIVPFGADSCTAQREGAERGEGVQLDDRRSGEQRGEAHFLIVIARSAQRDEAIEGAER